MQATNSSISAAQNRRSLIDILDGEPLAEFSIDGRVLTRFDLLKMEARAQRRALRLIKSRLHPDRLEELVTPEVEISDRRFRSYAQQRSGGFKSALVEAYVVGLDRPAYAKWMFGEGIDKRPWSDYVPMCGPVVNTDNPHEIFGHPEHFRLTHCPDGRHYEIETVGGLPVRWYIEFSNVGDVGSPDPEWPDSEKTGQLVLADGTWAAYAGHRWVKTQDGMRARLAIHYSDAAPDDVVESMKRHLAVEFNIWFTMAMLDYGTLSGHIDDFIGGTKGTRFRVDGRDISDEELLVWEVAAMRRALTLLRARLTPDQLEDLTGPETAETDRLLNKIAATANGQTRTAEVAVKIPGLTAEKFGQWMNAKGRLVDQWSEHLESGGGAACNTDRPGWLLAHPEHYRASLRDNGDVRLVGSLNGLPVRWTQAAAALDEDAPEIRNGARAATITLRNGLNVGAVRHSLRTTTNGCEGTLSVEFNGDVPDQILERYEEHMAVQFNNLVRMAKWELGLN